MASGEDIVKKAKSYVGKYPKHKNKFTIYFKGKYHVTKKGYYPKGYCTLFYYYVLAMLGLLHLVPLKALGKDADNTNKLYKYLKKKGKIITDPKKAKPGMPAFKKVGSTKKKTSGHTAIFIKYENGYVWTVDGNVKGGVVVRKKLAIWYLGFGDILPKEEKPKKKEAYVVGGKYTLKENMNIRANHNSKSKKLGVKKKGKVITAKQIYKTNNGAVWIRYKSDPNKWICAKTAKKTYLK